MRAQHKDGMMDRSQPTAFSITDDKILILLNPVKNPVKSWIFHLCLLAVSLLFLGVAFSARVWEPRSIVLFGMIAFYSFIRVISFNRSQKVVINQEKETVSLGFWPAPTLEFADIKTIVLLPGQAKQLYYGLTFSEPRKLALPVRISADFDPAKITQTEVHTELIPAVWKMLFGNIPMEILRADILPRDSVGSEPAADAVDKTGDY